jgi:hypothetical protein
MDDDERKAQILQGAQAFMKAGKIYKLPGHKSCATDLEPSKGLVPAGQMALPGEEHQKSSAA